MYNYPTRGLGTCLFRNFPEDSHALTPDEPVPPRPLPPRNDDALAAIRGL